MANAQLNLDKAYKAFFKGNAKFPKFKRKRHKQSYTTNVVNGNIQLLDGHIKLPKLKMVKIKQHQEIPSEYKIKSCTLSMTSSGKYYISIPAEYEKEIEIKKIEKVVGLDFAMDGLFVDSEGEKANYPKFYRQMLAKSAKEQRNLSLKKKGSSNWNKQRIRVAKIQVAWSISLATKSGDYPRSPHFKQPARGWYVVGVVHLFLLKTLNQQCFNELSL
ncbi:hypothetical protein NCCP133_28900 [Cytobacillus sp. NCCP-133]|nr:hypothetical protein NCCP133_28900 [Cytobacillus sp. NCCP-133]